MLRVASCALRVYRKKISLFITTTCNPVTRNKEIFVMEEGSTHSTINRIGFIGNYLPRQCGIATFTTDLCEAIAAEYEGTTCIALPVNDIEAGYPYPARVRFELIEKDIDSYRRAADFLNINSVDLVCLQHEYGIFGGRAGSHILALLRELRMPVVTTFHTILQDPDLDQQRVLEEVAALSDRVVVMSERGREFLQEIYGVRPEKIDFIPHGIPCIEDARFVRFIDDNGEVTYYATYTAYNDLAILPQLITTKEFLKFNIITLNGKAVQNKGMALFPRKIDGNYVMLSRQDGENNHIMFSDNIHFWQESKIIQEPTRPWEFIQIGNCGSPLETDEGWLVLTHGVGPMRQYCIGAILLDLENPAKIIARLEEPLLSPREEEREGYVPNVVYSCGAIIHNDELVIPYAMADVMSGIERGVRELINASNRWFDDLGMRARGLRTDLQRVPIESGLLKIRKKN